MAGWKIPHFDGGLSRKIIGFYMLLWSMPARQATQAGRDEQRPPLGWHTRLQSYGQMTFDPPAVDAAAQVPKIMCSKAVGLGFSKCQWQQNGRNMEKQFAFECLLATMTHETIDLYPFQNI